MRSSFGGVLSSVFFSVGRSSQDSGSAGASSADVVQLAANVLLAAVAHLFLGFAEAVFDNAADGIAKVTVVAGDLAPDVLSAESSAGTVSDDAVAFADVTTSSGVFASTLGVGAGGSALSALLGDDFEGVFVVMVALGFGELHNAGI